MKESINVIVVLDMSKYLLNHMNLIKLKRQI